MGSPFRIATAFSMAFCLFSPAALSLAFACSGDCAIDLAANPKAVEKYAKRRWAAISACAKRATPACPEACPVPDGTAAPFALSASCAGLVGCEMDELAISVYGTTWDSGGFCPTQRATECGVSRSKAAGRFVADKLKRRRTSKMHRLARDRSRCVLKANKPGMCEGEALCAQAGAWIDGLFPVKLGKRGYQLLPFTLSSGGEAVAAVVLSADSADWGTPGRESVVVQYDVDGQAMGTIVVYGGAVPTSYEILLGDLAPGPHAIGLAHDPGSSPASDSSVTVYQAPSAEGIPPGDPRHDFTKYAPILLGIDTRLNPVSLVSRLHRGNAVSDVPVIVYVKRIPALGFTTYAYTMIWSNEDGGTGLWPDLLIAQWGRTADIEDIMEVDVADDGTLLAVRYRPDESGSLADFTGSFRAGTHPLLRTRTANGLLADDGDSTLKFAIAPVEYDDSGVSRETALDLNPVSYRLMGQEMTREGKTEPTGNPATAKLSDLRNYLFLDYNIDTDTGGRVLRAIAVVDGIAYASDHFAASVNPTLNPRVSRGIGRTAIELPPGTAIEDIEQVGMQGVGTMSGILYGLNGFMLDADFLPTAHITFGGSLAAGGTDPLWLVMP